VVLQRQVLVVSTPRTKKESIERSLGKKDCREDVTIFHALSIHIRRNVDSACTAHSVSLASA
jgi:hypothetical protein